MARIVLPITFEGKVTLFTNTNDKNTKDGAGSILIPYFTQQKIDMGINATAVIEAVKLNTQFDASTKNSKKLLELCEVGLNPVFKDHKLMVQMLKKFYAKTVKTLGDYGIKVEGNKIVYPTDRAEICAAIAELINYNNSLPAGTRAITATFLSQNKIDLAANLDALTDIKQNNTDFLAAEKQSKSLCEKRDAAIAPVFEDLRGTGGFIVSQFPLTPKSGGDWGFVIDSTPKGAKLTIAKFKMGGTKILYSVVAGSIIQNTGTVPLTITKGAKGTGTPIVIVAGDHWQVEKGYTTMTINNPSLTVTCQMSYMNN